MTFTDRYKLDVSEHMEKKGKFNYLSWVYAIKTLQEQDPKATWDFLPSQTFPDNTMMVYTKVNAFETSHVGFLPVLDFKNQPIKNPNAFQINTAMQRCLTKTISLHGIGLYIYAGEDLPPSEPEPEYTKEETDSLKELTCLYQGAEDKNELDTLIDKYAEQMSALPDEFQGQLGETIKGCENALKSGNVNSMQGKKDKIKCSFESVKDAGDWCTRMFTVVQSLKNPEQLREWQEYNQARINALDILSAEKYKKDGKTPRERFIELLSNKLNETSEAPLAAE